MNMLLYGVMFFFSSRRRHTRWPRDWSSDVCSSDLNGADAHFLDPLTHLCTTMETYEKIPMLAHELAHKYCNGKWIALGGGGYDMWRVVPRAWAQICGVSSHATGHRYGT